MTTAPRAGGWVIALSFLVAFLLAGVPLPDSLDRFRPDWVAMVLIYWGMALPHRVGIGVGWLVGLLLDVGRGALLGQLAQALGATRGTRPIDALDLTLRDNRISDPAGSARQRG